MNTNDRELFKIYPINSYKTADVKFIETMHEEYDLEELEQFLINRDNGYHTRIHKNRNYIFMGDLDGYRRSIDDFIQKIISLLTNNYNINIQEADVCYTKNFFKEGSYHYSIPKLYCSCEKLKEIHLNLERKYINEFKYKKNGVSVKCIDTTIYSEHWFRLPFQSKELHKGTAHKIIKGELKNFIVEYIPSYSKNIENVCFVDDVKEEIFIDNTEDTKEENIFIEENQKCENVINNCNQNIENKEDIKNDNVDIILQKSKKNYEMYTKYRKLFDKCLKQERFDDYNDWVTIGMALKNIYGLDAFDLFNYFSSKSKKYEGVDKTARKYESFKSGSILYKNMGSLYKMAKDDNTSMYIEIMKKEESVFTETTFAKKLFELAGDNFVYKEMGPDNYVLYCYNGKYWQQGTLLMRQYISNELYTYYINHINDIYVKKKTINKYKTKIENIQNYTMEQNIIRHYKKYGVKDIEFDDKWWLFGFRNTVYDLSTHQFRDYLKTDYISITTGYDWIEPDKEEIDQLNLMIDQIMPIESEKNLYKTILSTSLEGRCLENFIIFNGGGRNGKGVIDEILLIALGNYGFTANNSILFEKNKTGTNPEKANIHKKRLVFFKEPSSKDKFENSVIKELTGGGTFGARGHHESDTIKKLCNTTICECNKRPLFAEEPTTAEVERLIDILFRATFTEDESLLSLEYYHKADKKYKNTEFQEKHKRALLKILMDSHKIYSQNNFKFIIPESIKNRTTEYLEMSCVILQWFMESYILTNDNKNILKIKNIFEDFKVSEYFGDTTKAERRKYNYKYFVEYFSTNITTNRYYKAKYGKKGDRNVLLGWKKIETNNNLENDDNFFNELDICNKSPILSFDL